MKEIVREPLANALAKQVNQTAHGFGLLAPVYFNGTSWVLAYANNISQSNVTGVVTRIIDANRFEVTTHGKFKLLTTPSVTEVLNDGGNMFKSIAVSGTGKYQVAASQMTAGVYVSSDYGSTWSDTTCPNGDNYQSASISQSGQYQLVGTPSVLNTVMMSTDYGATWVAKTIPAGGNSPAQVYVSTTGQYMVICGADVLLKSTDYGSTWTSIPTTAGSFYRALISDDGQTIIVAATGGFTETLYKSTDGGTSFSSIGVARKYSSIYASSNMQYITATVTNGYIYTSSDYGASWTQRESSRDWRSLTVSRDGKYQLAGSASASPSNFFMSSNVLEPA